MKILNSEVADCLSKGLKIKLDLGTGGAAEAGFFSVDHLPLPGVDIVADLDEPLDLLPDNCCSYLTTRHTLEHVGEFMPLMRELHRILAKDAVIDIVVPHFSNTFGYSDPTHVRFFGAYSMHYFADTDDQPGNRKVPCFYTDTRFFIEHVKIVFYTSGRFDGIVGKFMNRAVNKSFKALARWERRLSWIINAAEVHYRLRPKKTDT